MNTKGMYNGTFKNLMIENLGFQIAPIMKDKNFKHATESINLLYFSK